MKAVAIISETENTHSAQWQFDKVMAAIAYDLELTVVFMPNAITQLIHTKAWNSLKLYGVNDIYTWGTEESEVLNAIIPTQKIDIITLRLMIQQADIVL